jgi:hypothetical protein
VALFFREILLQRAWFWNDWLTQVYPFRTFAAVSLSQGEMPLWNPFAFSGMPFQADIQSALFYIPNLLLTFFVRDGVLSMYWIEVMVIAHYWLAGVAMYYLAREMGQEGIFALFSGLVFSLSGFMIARAVHPAFVEHIAWLPFMFLLLRRAVLLGSWKHAIICGLVTGHALLAGAPQISLFILLLLGAYTLFLVLFVVAEGTTWTKFSRLRFAVATAVLAAGVAAIQLLPTLEMIPLSQRAGFMADELLYHLSPGKLVTLVIPGFFGVTGAQGSTYWPSREFGAFWETCSYIGIAGLAAAAYSLGLARRDRQIAFLVAVAIISLLAAMGDQFIVHKLFNSLVPGFSLFRGAARIMLLATFALALLAGFGLREMVRGIRAAPRRAYVFALVPPAAVLLVWGICELMLPAVPDGDLRAQAIRRMINGESARAAILAVTFSMLLLSARMSSALCVAAVSLMQYADMTSFGFNLNNGQSSIDDYYREGRSIVPQLREEGRRELFRVTVRKDQILLMDRNQGMVDRVFLTEGYTPLALRRNLPPARDWDATYDLLNSKHRIEVNERAQQMSIRTVDTYLPRAFVVHEARVMQGDSAAAAFMRSADFNPWKMIVLEDGVALPPAADSLAPIGRAAIRGFTLNSASMDVEMPRPGFLVMSEIHYPGWVAYVDGEPREVQRANWSLRSVPLAAGSHRVEMRFEPASFRLGAILSGITLAVGMCTLGFLEWRRRRATDYPFLSSETGR